MPETLLIKVGGGGTINWDYIAADLVSLSKKYRLLLIHGASHRRDQVASNINYPTKTITSPAGITSVYTDKKALEIFLMVYPGLVNKEIVAQLQKNGLNAIGLSGVDGKLWEGKRKNAILIKEGEKTKVIKDSFTGKVEKINVALIELLFNAGYIPVICPPAISYEGDIINTDNDIAAAITASKLQIKKIIILFEAPGFLQDINDEKSLIKKINKKEIDNMMEFAKGRMKKKLIGAKYALENGVKTIYFGDGRVKNPIINALAGEGTILS